MIQSMTAFGRARTEGERKDITVEIRAVNGRYFDASVRLPRDYSAFEDKIRTYVQKNGATRGKIEISVQINRHGTEASGVTLDTALAAGYIGALRRMASEFGLTDDISVMTVAQNRELFVYEKPEEDMEKEWAELFPVLADAVSAFADAKRAEGGRIEVDLREKIENVRSLAQRVGVLSEEDKSGYRARLEARLRQALSDQKITADEQRILTECAIFADKVAVDEELVRLGSHFEAFEAILAANEPAGRKLDFLMQEMNRETNTIGSKCNNAEIAQHVVEVKCELEKIREQIQNLE